MVYFKYSVNLNGKLFANFHDLKEARGLAKTLKGKNETDRVEIITNNKYPTIHGYGKIIQEEKASSKGWHEQPDQTGKAPIHKEVAIRAQARVANNQPMKKPRTPKQESILELTGIEKSFSYGNWIEYPIKLQISKEKDMLYVSLNRKYQYQKDYDRVLSYGSFLQFSSIDFDRFQVAKGYQIDVHIKTNRLNNPALVVISFVPEGDDLYGVYIYENNSRQIASFEINEKEYQKVEMSAKSKKNHLGR